MATFHQAAPLLSAVEVGATLFAIALVALGYPASAAAQQPCSDPVALFQSVRNSVQLVQVSTGAPLRAAQQVPVCAGDRIEVGDDSRATIFILASGPLFTINQNAAFVIPGRGDDGSIIVNLIRGALLYISRQRAVEIRTPFVNASIEGTEFLVRVQEDRTVITVFEGVVRATNPFGTLEIGAGQQGVAVQGQAPQLEIVVRPRDAVQWALYFEPIFPADSLEQLALVADADRDARFYVRRAALLLSAGQLDSAQSDLDEALALDPASGDVYVLRTVVAVALNDRAEALDHARAAVDRAPDSSAAHVALSYALQASFQLEAARDAASQAVAVQPDDGTAWARLAELRLARGDIAGAFETAQRATSLAPQDTRAHTVYGFSSLANLDLDGAIAAFEEAISLDPDNPLPRLGLGLAKIRQGHLSLGRQEIEIAVALNPENALMRSYLGKAYFEEKREPLPGPQLALAKELDPLDPTPWLYDAIRKQTLNRPIEALADLQASIARNDNRGVYRSRLLLDEDLAARGVNVSRVYGDLGFEQLALVQGWRSLEIDPANHSAHRLLADNYLALPSHQIARDSELLQSQLLQPVNINPVQPRLADNGLNFLADIGISDVGVSEFTRLFARNEVRVVADGLFGTQDTAAENVIVSGILNRASFSVGHFSFRTDGIRDNHDIAQKIWNVFAQVDASSATSVQVELRHTDTDQGDRALLFDTTFFDPALRSDSDTSAVRLGVRHRFSPSSTVIGSYAHRRLESDFAASGLVITDDDRAHFVEVRHLQRWDRAHLTAGFGHFRGEGVERLTFLDIELPPLALDTRHTNAYVYATVSVATAGSLTGGLSVDSVTNWQVGERRQANPKIGVSWALTPRTFLRGAAFRALRRTLISGQTIEPTHVSGFNQFFDDAVGSASWRYGIATDQRIWDNGFIGAEYSSREVTVPVFDLRAGEVVEGSIEERLGRAYFYATLTRMLALGAEYQASRFFDPAGENPLLLERSTTQKAPVQVRFFAPWGLFARLRTTYVRQNGVFRNRQFELFRGRDQFWVTDVSIGYRLPRRWGIAGVEIRNMFDRQFGFQDDHPRDPTILPGRQVMSRLSVTF